MKPVSLLAACALAAVTAAGPAAAQSPSRSAADAESRAVVDAALRQVETYFAGSGRSRAQGCGESAQGMELELLNDPRAILSRQRDNRALAEIVAPARLPVPICFRPYRAAVDQQVALFIRFDSLLFARVPERAEQFAYVLGFAQPAERDASTLACDRAAAVLNSFDAPLRGRFTAVRWGAGLSDLQVRQRRVLFREAPERIVPPPLRSRVASHVQRRLVPCPV